MIGVKEVEVNRKQSKVTISGYVEPSKVLKRVKITGKRAQFWPYVPYNLVAHPSCLHKLLMTRGLQLVLSGMFSSPADSSHEPFTSLFSDENPHACSIM